MSRSQSIRELLDGSQRVINFNIKNTAHATTVSSAWQSKLGGKPQGDQQIVQQWVLPTTMKLLNVGVEVKLATT